MTADDPKPSFRELLLKRPDPLTSAALTIPVFVIYHLGVVSVDRRASVDPVSGLVLALLRASVPAYVITTFAIALLLAVPVWVQQKRGVLPPMAAGRVLLESGAFALLLLVSIGWVTHRLARTLDDSATQALSVIDKLVLSAGAGFYEELVFRALMLTGGAWLLARLMRIERVPALSLAVVVSSIAFSLSYNFGPFGEPFVLQAFGYRVLLGVFLAGLYLFRGFAVTVYTHVFYAALVFFVYA